MSTKFSMNEYNRVMSSGYWERWNDEVQAKIDADIEANRKADGEFVLEGISDSTEVKVEQISHSFIFGAHIFNFNQLGNDERNEKYKALYGDFFNSATVAFYWKQLELEENKLRFSEEYHDTAEFWNTCTCPKHEPHWRRPAVDPVVKFCQSKGIRLHGHTLVWGSCRWQLPQWLINQLPEDCKKLGDFKPNANDGTLKSEAAASCFGELTAEEFADKYPEFAELLNVKIAKRIAEIATRYGNIFDSWDVVNESATDFGLGRMVEGSRICKSWYAPMPGDYTYRGFKIAEGYFPRKALLNINDYNMSDAYLNQTLDLLKRGCKVDIMGAQMHLFDPQVCLDIAAGTSDIESPEAVYEKFNRLGKAGLPIHLSEITITAPDNDTRGQAIQAVIARNLYRLWFSLKPMMGITWWNVVDGCGAPGEPAVSGLFSLDMEPKPAYYALRDLIHNEWKTRLTTESDASGKITFRGFRGQYRLSWVDQDGNNQVKEVTLY